MNQPLKWEVCVPSLWDSVNHVSYNTSLTATNEWNTFNESAIRKCSSSFFLQVKLFCLALISVPDCTLSLPKDYFKNLSVIVLWPRRLLFMYRNGLIKNPSVIIVKCHRTALGYHSVLCFPGCQWQQEKKKNPSLVLFQYWYLCSLNSSLDQLITTQHCNRVFVLLAQHNKEASLEPGENTAPYYNNMSGKMKV